MRLSPSILSADFTRLYDDIQRVKEVGGIDLIHIDVMDGHFVPNITIGVPVVEAIHKAFPDLELDVHLMIEKPENYVEAFAKSGATYITVHAEAAVHLHRTLTQIKTLGVKAGVALNPATPLCMLDYCLEEADLVLLMTVNPGFGGQVFIESMVPKIVCLKEMIEKKKAACKIEVDGGIHAANIHTVTQAGVDIVVAGSAIFSAANYKEAIDSLRRNARG